MNANSNANVLEDEDHWNSDVESVMRAEYYTLHIDGMKFDVTVRDDSYMKGWKQLFISSSKNRPHCVFMTYRGSPYDENNTNVSTREKEDAPNVNLQTLRFDVSCTTSNSHDMPRGLGTNSMLLGAMHSLMNLATRDEMAHLLRFVITDKSYFSCPNLDTEIEIIITRVILTGKSYYEDRINARPLRRYIVNLLRSINTRFEERMYDKEALKKCIFGEIDDGSPPLARPEARERQLKWLASRRDKISDAIDGHDGYVRDFYTSMQNTYGCAFLACCWRQLSIYYGMGPLSGSEWVVSFEDVPRLHESSGYRLTSKEFEGGGLGLGVRRRTMMMPEKVRRFMRCAASEHYKCTMEIPDPNVDELEGKPLTRPSTRNGAFRRS